MFSYLDTFTYNVVFFSVEVCAYTILRNYLKEVYLHMTNIVLFTTSQACLCVSLGVLERVREREREREIVVVTPYYF